ncbi:hypothetical protein Bca101_026806 [Brassica carinata]
MAEEDLQCGWWLLYGIVFVSYEALVLRGASSDGIAGITFSLIQWFQVVSLGYKFLNKGKHGCESIEISLLIMTRQVKFF